MRIVLDNVENTTYYFDNILIFTDTWDDHVKTLSKVFNRLRTHGLTAKPKKCHFGFPTINYLGNEISGETISPLPDKINAISNLSNPPTTKKGLRSFLGFLSFYRKFIPQLSTIVAPLNQLLKNKSVEPLIHTDETIGSFSIAKNILLNKPILKLPVLTKSFVVRSDSSGLGLGAVLLQYHEETPFPVAFASRQLTPGEQKFSTIERECLSILFAAHKFSSFLLGKKFFLEVDHKPLVYLKSMKNLNHRLARWALCLQQFEFTVIHLPGVQNVGADFLSRCE